MNTNALQAVALSVRSLAMDAVQAANSGHPGMPMGMAGLGAMLFGELMNHNPGDWKWPNRDRLVRAIGVAQQVAHQHLACPSRLHDQHLSAGLPVEVPILDPAIDEARPPEQQHQQQAP